MRKVSPLTARDTEVSAGARGSSASEPRFMMCGGDRAEKSDIDTTANDARTTLAEAGNEL
jgi:hypothetical protein